MTLEAAGVVTAPLPTGMRELTQAYQEGHPEFREWAVSEFAGCDGGDPLAKTWVLGFEHGESAAEGGGQPLDDDGYPISRQRTYRYNRQVFKLLTTIEGGPLFAAHATLQAAGEQIAVLRRAMSMQGQVSGHACSKAGDAM